ncbi:MAG TPA: MlaD family protein [Candidatus Deferrimicrobiaceae bacterium]
MARKTSHIVVGLFVVLGTLLAAALVVWVGASRYFERGSRYVACFDESVQGLQSDSPVKYRGVEVGRVEEIRVAPDNRLIEVLMKLDLPPGGRDNVVAELKSVGITGLVFVDLNRLEPGETPHIAKVGFPVDYPLVPSRPSAIRQVVTRAEELVEKIGRIDFEGVTGQFIATSKSAERLFDGPGTRQVVENLDRLSARLDRLIGRIDNVYSNERLARITDAAAADAEALGKLIARVETEIGNAAIGDRSAEAKALIAEARAAVAEARTVVAAARTTVTDAGTAVTDARAEIKGMKLAETGQSAARIAEGLEEQQRTLGPAARSSVEELRRTSAELRELVKQLKDSPSELLFSEPPPHRK